MKPLPVDEQKPLLGGADENDLIMWLAYKEAKAMIQFDVTPPAAGKRRAMGNTRGRLRLRRSRQAGPSRFRQLAARRSDRPAASRSTSMTPPLEGDNTSQRRAEVLLSASEHEWRRAEGD